MTNKYSQLNDILRRISDEIGITTSMIDKATNSYEAVGRWIGDGVDFDVTIFPQGSMSLGTAIKPISDKDDYDIDLVCLLENGYELDAKAIKNIVGDILKENDVYRKKIELEGEGKRCWKMKYDEFHMDILPCVPANIYYGPNSTEIRLTHKIGNSLYIDKFSNPIGYRKWFENRMMEILQKEKRVYASANNVRIDDVPTYKVKTPLQIAIQLLKRHRDIMFKDNPDIAPISIIITTLAAKAYNGEANIYDALKNILIDMSNYIEIKNGIAWIQNPVMPLENFADKWQNNPNLKHSFYEWLSKARSELVFKPLEVSGLDSLGTLFKENLGDKSVERAFRKYADDILVTRNSGKLYSAGLATGLTKNASENSTNISRHNFYGIK